MDHVYEQNLKKSFQESLKRSKCARDRKISPKEFTAKLMLTWKRRAAAMRAGRWEGKASRVVRETFASADNKSRDAQRSVLHYFAPRRFERSRKSFSFVIASTNTCGLEVAFGVFVKIKVDKWTGEEKPNRIDGFVADLFMTFGIYRGRAWICICKGFCLVELRRFRKCGISLYLCSGWEWIDRHESVTRLLWSQSD